jgi:hypothetical protein
MRTIQLKLYELGELSAKCRETAIKELGDINVDFDWYEMVFMDFTAICENIGVTIMKGKTHFSGFYSQGDGSAFTATVNIPKLLEAVKAESWKTNAPNLELGLPVCEADRRLIRLMESEAIDLSPKIIQPSRSYYVKAELNEQYPYNNHRFNRIETELEKIENWLQRVADKLNRFLYKALQDDNEYHTTEQAIAETIEANGFHFTADGKLATHLEHLAEQDELQTASI